MPDTARCLLRYVSGHGSVPPDRAVEVAICSRRNICCVGSCNTMEVRLPTAIVCLAGRAPTVCTDRVVRRQCGRNTAPSRPHTDTAPVDADRVLRAMTLICCAADVFTIGVAAVPTNGGVCHRPALPTGTEVTIHATGRTLPDTEPPWAKPESPASGDLRWTPGPFPERPRIGWYNRSRSRAPPPDAPHTADTHLTHSFVSESLSNSELGRSTWMIRAQNGCNHPAIRAAGRQSVSARRKNPRLAGRSARRRTK